ncbi:hypothetical protein EVAR_38605_1 [Eumeta japonica]|uniref:Uncharacterized protein n=1 Tax=Eumeta variegata TaxID=151549 RepID=A0A4C1WST9_EUMVA|nr:hypothetical protein EVAR_38605_1 [Eumeta japonica]
MYLLTFRTQEFKGRPYRPLTNLLLLSNYLSVFNHGYIPPYEIREGRSSSAIAPRTQQISIFAANPYNSRQQRRSRVSVTSDVTYLQHDANNTRRGDSATRRTGARVTL